MTNMTFTPEKINTGSITFSKEEFNLFVSQILADSSLKDEMNISSKIDILFKSFESNTFTNQFIADASLKDEVINISPKIDILFTSSDSNENIINKKRTLQLERDFTNRLLHYFVEDEFEYGFENRADLLVNQQLKQNALATKEWLNKIYVTNFNNPNILVGVLRLIARIEVDDISPVGKTMAIAALTHKNIEVQECGIRAFEAWATSDSIEILKNLKVSPKWLQNYLDKVIANIQQKYAIAG